jgi:hypothetical protein
MSEALREVRGIERVSLQRAQDDRAKAQDDKAELANWLEETLKETLLLKDTHAQQHKDQHALRSEFDLAKQVGGDAP